MITLDALRTRYPHLGFAVYALVPGGPITLECHTPDGKFFSFKGQTEAAALTAGFPEEDEPALAPTPTPNVFE